MSTRHAVTNKVLPTVLAINLIWFADYLHAQQCHMAHDKEALRALVQRASGGDADAQCGLGRQYEFSLGVPPDNNQAALWLQKSADQGNVIAQVELGVVFDKLQDYAQALIWYRKAAEQGNARAEYNIGLAYQNGEAVPKDVTKAVERYRKAADHGDSVAQLNLAVMYDQGAGIAQDYSQAASWYLKAAEQGLAEAQYGLGFLYLNGTGLPKDDTQAVTWMLKAAEQGESKAQYNLGAHYINGVGVNRDLSEGYFWIFLANSLATDSDLKRYAMSSLGTLTRVMTKNNIRNAQKRAQAWLNEHPSGPHPTQ